MSIINQAYPKTDNHLDAAAFLRFEFPHPDGTALTSFFRTCPFYENAIIKESQAAMLIEQQPIGRLGTLFGHTGAKSRKFDVSFSMTLPFIKEVAKTFQLDPTPSNLSKKEQQDMFFVPKYDDNQTYNTKIRSFAEYKKSFLGIFVDGTATPATVTSEGEKLKEMYGETFGFPGLANGAASKSHAGAVDVIVYWLELIRSSVKSYAPNPAVGPPIIRLFYGIMYSNIPTIASNYNISIDENAGYDVVSLLPRRINISLTLNEILDDTSVGFRSGTTSSEDSVYGWEEVVGRMEEQHTIGGDTVGREDWLTETGRR
tara:strand:+ start:27274 stop:28218 length:945 start_codon:yes stop_codon:yes gene_type:complete